jgi:hypothetical protein
MHYTFFINPVHQKKGNIMPAKLATLLKSLNGKSYQQIRALMRRDNFDYRAMIHWWKLIPRCRRKAIKHRLHLFLFWQEGRFGSWKKFMKLWRKRSPVKRKKILAHWRKKEGTYRHKTLILIAKAIRTRAINKKTFRYLLRPLTHQQLQRVQLYWWAKLENCCNHAKVIRTGANDPCLEIRLSPSDSILYF